MHRANRGFFRHILSHPHLRFFTADVGAAAPQSDPDANAGAGDQPTAADEDEDDEPLGEAGIKALQREREAAKAEREARRQHEEKIAQLEAQVKEFQDAAKSEEQKQAEAAEAERKKGEETAAALASAQAMNLRYQVAADKGIDLKLAARLSGESREDLENDADALLELIGASPKQPLPDRSAGRGGEPVKPRTLNEAIGQHYS